MPGGTPANPALTTPGGHPDTSGGGPPTAQDLQLQPSTSPTHVDMFHEHQYASLLEAVSNIHMSARPFDLEDVDDNRDLDSRLTDRRTVTEEDIFDIHQVIVHRQREYEHQMRQVRPNYHFDGAQHDLLRATQLSPPPPGHSADDRTL
ncbi:hypothetical protein BGZ73_000551 [Actinomortierella ambigua]|nr:hypothetical protein BGZ73_000551 [Actinomortierella ambigua]